MIARLARIVRLGVKELYSLRADPVMLFLIVYTFTVAIYTVATGARFEVENAAVAVVDEDGSRLSARLKDALLEPFFQPPASLSARDVDAALDAGRYGFVVQIPPKFEEDIVGGRVPSVGIEVDATAMSQAGNGARYLQEIIQREVLAMFPGRAVAAPVTVVVRVAFNPNLRSGWFMAVMQVINNVTMLSVILTGAALIREREHGTIEHLLVMPVTPMEIMLAKIWANGLVIVVAATLSLIFVVEGLLAVPIAGSIPLFVAATVLYLFSVTALGILVATIAGSMGQFALVVMPVLVVMNLLSGSSTPLESMPDWLQTAMQVSPSTHFVKLSQSVLYRGAGVEIIWPQMAALFALGLVFLALAGLRFRAALLRAQ